MAAEPVSFTRRGGRLTERQQRPGTTCTHATSGRPAARPEHVGRPGFRLDTARCSADRAAGRRDRQRSRRGDGGRSGGASGARLPRTRGLRARGRADARDDAPRRRHERTAGRRQRRRGARPRCCARIRPRAAAWFPDPWHKKRHHKRRLVTPEFARLAARVLEPGGVWRLATDWEDYAEQCRRRHHRVAGLRRRPVPRFEGRPQTRFEGKGVAAGRRSTISPRRPRMTHDRDDQRREAPHRRGLGRLDHRATPSRRPRCSTRCPRAPRRSRSRGTAWTRPS